MNLQEQFVGGTSWSFPGTGNMWASLPGKLGRVLSAGVRRNVRSVHHHNEEAFRYLLATEGKRSERSGRSFYVLFMYLAGPEGAAVRMDDKVTSRLLPAFSGVLRETDYIGWYRNDHIVGGVLTTLEDHSAEEVSCRIEQRFVRGLRGSFPAEEVSRFRFHFIRSQELERVESVDRVLALS
jgi:hypothetical protein